MGTRKDFFGIYRQSGHALSKTFAGPWLGETVCRGSIFVLTAWQDWPFGLHGAVITVYGTTCMWPTPCSAERHDTSQLAAGRNASFWSRTILVPCRHCWLYSPIALTHARLLITHRTWGMNLKLFVIKSVTLPVHVGSLRWSWGRWFSVPLLSQGGHLRMNVGELGVVIPE